MNKLLLSLLVILLAAACEKALPDVNDYFPKVNTLSATIQTDGSVLVEGEVESVGAAPIEYLGFCCGTRTEPELLDRQLLAVYADGRFTAVYTGFNPDSTYYFRSWATNEYGYVYGNTLSLNHIIATPVTPPCNLVLNTCNIGGGQPTATYYTVSAPNYTIGYWEISAATSTGPTVKYRFGSALTTGIYKTVNFDSPGTGDVFVSFYSGAISASLNAGTDVYVNRIAPDVYEIAICNAPWNYNGGSPLYFNTRFKSPL